MLIRPATAGDAAGIRAVCAASLPFDSDGADLAGILSPADLIVAEAEGEVTGVAGGSVRRGPPVADGPVRGHVDLLAVAPAARGQGTGARLLAAVEDRLRSDGADVVRLGQGSPVYLWPGVDPRYTVMTCLANRSGYERQGETVNMIAGLAPAAPLGTEADERRLAADGISLRRAAAAEAGPLVEWLRQGPWGGLSWPDEVALALTRDPPGCHVAVRGPAYLAFACHGVVRRPWFGPMGTLPAEQRHGLGAVLLKRCLADMRQAGHPSAQIGWTGPVRFYARAVGAHIDRVFWVYEKAL